MSLGERQAGARILGGGRGFLLSLHREGWCRILSLRGGIFPLSPPHFFFPPKSIPNSFVNAIFPAVSRAGNFTPQKLRAPHVTIKLLKATEDSEDSGFPPFQETGLFLHSLPPGRVAGVPAALVRGVPVRFPWPGVAATRRAGAGAEPAVSPRSCCFIPAKCRLTRQCGLSKDVAIVLFWIYCLSGFFLSQTKDVFGNDAALLSPATL